MLSIVREEKEKKKEAGNLVIGEAYLDQWYLGW
jgi:hypothetical protein